MSPGCSSLTSLNVTNFTAPQKDHCRYFTFNTLGALVAQRLPTSPSSWVPSHLSHHWSICLNVPASRMTEAWCGASIQKFTSKKLRVCKDQCHKWCGRTKERQGGHLPHWSSVSYGLWRRKYLLFDGWHGLPCLQRTAGEGNEGNRKQLFVWKGVGALRQKGIPQGTAEKNPSVRDRIEIVYFRLIK